MIPNSGRLFLVIFSGLPLPLELQVSFPLSYLLLLSSKMRIDMQETEASLLGLINEEALRHM